MTPTLCIVLLALLWAAAAVFWFLDTPSPRHVANIVLDGEFGAEEPLVA